MPDLLVLIQRAFQKTVFQTAVMGLIISDEYLMIHILNNLPSEYELQVEQTEENINKYDNLLISEQVCSTLSLKFERLNASNEDDKDDKETEKALLTIQFKGSCNNCGNVGTRNKIAC